MPLPSRESTPLLANLLAVEGWENVLDDLDCTELATRVTPLSVPRHDAHFGTYRSGRCPFVPDHGELFEVNTTGYFCQGCGDGGTTAEFFARLEHCTPAEAQRRLTRFLEEGTLQQRRSEQQALWRVTEYACSHWQEILCSSPSGEPGRHWLATQGISEETRARFSLGFVPDQAAQDRQLLDYLLSKGFSVRALEESGLCTVESDGRMLTVQGRKDAITIPVKDARGNYWGFFTQPIVGDFVSFEPNDLLVMRRLSYHRYSRLVYPVPSWPKDFRRHSFVLLTPSVWEAVLLHQAGIESALHVGDMSLRHPGRIQRTIAAMTSQIIVLCSTENAGGDLFHEGLAELGALTNRIEVLVLPKEQRLSDLLTVDGPASFRDRLMSTVSIQEFLGS